MSVKSPAGLVNAFEDGSSVLRDVDAGGGQQKLPGQMLYLKIPRKTITSYLLQGIAPRHVAVRSLPDIT